MTDDEISNVLETTCLPFCSSEFALFTWWFLGTQNKLWVQFTERWRIRLCLQESLFFLFSKRLSRLELKNQRIPLRWNVHSRTTFEFRSFSPKFFFRNLRSTSKIKISLKTIKYHFPQTFQSIFTYRLITFTTSNESSLKNGHLLPLFFFSEHRLPRKSQRHAALHIKSDTCSSRRAKKWKEK